MVGATWQFLDDLAPGASVIAFMDCTKLGRLSAKDLDYHMELLQRSLTRRPHQGIALVTAPLCIRKSWKRPAQRGGTSPLVL